MHMSNESLLVSALTRFVHLARARLFIHWRVAERRGGAGDFFFT